MYPVFMQESSNDESACDDVDCVAKSNSVGVLIIELSLSDPKIHLSFSTRFLRVY